MNRHLIIPLLTAMLPALCACSGGQRADGWYPIADYPDNSIVGPPLATVNDFETVELLTNTFVIDGDTVSQLLIQGRVIPEKLNQWADGTEQLIGKRLGYVYNDSVICSPQINTRIESGRFQIISPDTTLIREIHKKVLSVMSLN